MHIRKIDRRLGHVMRNPFLTPPPGAGARQRTSDKPVCGDVQSQARQRSLVRPLAVALLVMLSMGAPAPDARAAALRILAFGDSLTAGPGLSGEESFPARLQAALRARGHDVVIVDAGVSGDTAAGGLARLDWSLGDGADGVIVELGANDALRGVDPAVTRSALDALIARLKARGVEVLLAGMKAPPNMGPIYAAAFNAIYPELARKHGVLLYPFFLDGVAAREEMNQSDGMHPNAAGVAVIVERILPEVEALIARIRAKAEM